VILLEAPDELRRLLRDQPSLWLPGVGLVALLFGLATLIWIVPAVAK
jgi:hypothetical protein